MYGVTKSHRGKGTTQGRQTSRSTHKKLILFSIVSLFSSLLPLSFPRLRRLPLHPYWKRRKRQKTFSRRSRQRHSFGYRHNRTKKTKKFRISTKVPRRTWIRPNRSSTETRPHRRYPCRSATSARTSPAMCPSRTQRWPSQALA